jgi:hypothetical protein
VAGRRESRGAQKWQLRRPSRRAFEHCARHIARRRAQWPLRSGTHPSRSLPPASLRSSCPLSACCTCSTCPKTRCVLRRPPRHCGLARARARHSSLTQTLGRHCNLTRAGARHCDLARRWRGTVTSRWRRQGASTLRPSRLLLPRMHAGEALQPRAGRGRWRGNCDLSWAAARCFDLAPVAPAAASRTRWRGAATSRGQRRGTAASRGRRYCSLTRPRAASRGRKFCGYH